MAVIREVFELVDKFTAPFTKFISYGEQAASSAKYMGTTVKTQSDAIGVRLTFLNESMAKQAARTAELQAEYQKLVKEGNAKASVLRQMESQIKKSENQEYQYAKAIGKTTLELEKAKVAENAAIAAMEKKEQAIKRATQSTNELGKAWQFVRNSFLIKQGIELATNIAKAADNQAQLTARINMMNDGLQTTEELQEMIYQSAQRSRGAYNATADMVGKFGTLSPDAFGSSAEIVAFTEQINKHLTLSSTTQSGADAAILQLTQAMSAGVLRGEELNTILIQTPTIAQQIAKYMGTSVGEMRKLASEGVVTADVVKNALFAYAEETNEQFKNMPLTWAQLWQKGMNAIQQASKPILSEISKGATWLSENWQELIPVIAGVAAGFAFMGITAVMANSAAIASTLAAMWPVLAVVAAVGTLVYVLHQSGVTWQEMGSVAGSVLGFVYAIGHNAFAGLYNVWATFVEFFLNVTENRTTAVAHLFHGMADAILGIIETLAGAIDAVLGTGMSDAVSGFRSNLSGWVDDKFGKNAVEIKRMSNLDVSTTAQRWSEKGSGIGAKLDNMNLNLSDMAGSLGGLGNFGNFAATGGIGDIGKVGSVGSVKNVEGDIRLSDEYLKIYRDIAERKYMNQIQIKALAPNVNVNVTPGANNKLSPKDIANAVRHVIVEEMAAETEVAY